MLSQQTAEVILFMFTEDLDEGFYPERRLWIAVVISAIEEYTEWCLRITNYYRTSGRPVDRSFKFSLRHIRHQCSTEWFHMICEMANFSADRVEQKFDELDGDFGIAHIPFENQPERFVSNWELRKAAAGKH